MKKTIVLSLVLLVVALFNYSLAADGGKLVPADKLSGVTTLVINAQVTVVLVNNDKPVLEVVGNKSLSQLVTFEKSGNTLVINSAKKKNLTGAGVIYISANEFKKIQINGDANIRTLNTLQIPNLDVVINAVCQFHIENIGEVNVITTAKYTIEQDRQEQTFPANVLPNVKKYSF